MAFSRVQSKSDGCNAGELVRPVLRKILHWRISHAGRLLVALLACVPATALLSAAQEDSRPQITPGERKVPRKKDAGPRAIGLLQLGTNGKTSIVPVAILVNGKFFDATAYRQIRSPWLSTQARFTKGSAPEILWACSRSEARFTRIMRRTTSHPGSAPASGIPWEPSPQPKGSKRRLHL